MKYIRTKDGIYEVLWETEIDFMLKDGPFKKQWAVKQSNNIEELCDEFVGIDNDNYHFHFTELEKVNESYSYLNEEYKAFYGAIWTDKGLIYVTKMNEKGELELL